MIIATTDKHRNIPKRKTPCYHHLSTTVKLPSLWSPLAVVSAEARIWSTTPKCIDKRSKNWLDWKVHITPKTQACDLCSLLFNIIVFVECPSCPDWKENIIKIAMIHHFLFSFRCSLFWCTEPSGVRAPKGSEVISLLTKILLN